MTIRGRCPRTPTPSDIVPTAASLPIGAGASVVGPDNPARHGRRRPTIHEFFLAAGAARENKNRTIPLTQHTGLT